MATMGSCEGDWTDPNAIVHITYVNIAVVFTREIC